MCAAYPIAFSKTFFILYISLWEFGWEKQLLRGKYNTGERNEREIKIFLIAIIMFKISQCISLY